MRHVRDLRLRLAPCSDVLVSRQRAAADQRLVQDRNGSPIPRCPDDMPRLGLTGGRQPLLHEIRIKIVAKVAVR
jgi:hypothetical protein